MYRQQFTEAEFDKLGDRFEDQEHKLLGSGGFEGSLKEVGDLEKTLGIHHLAKFNAAVAAMPPEQARTTRAGRRWHSSMIRRRTRGQLIDLALADQALNRATPATRALTGTAPPCSPAV